MEIIYTILFTAPHMEPLLFAASSRSNLGTKVRDHVNSMIAGHNEDKPDDHTPELGQYADLDTAAGWLADAYGYQFEIEAHVEDV